MLEQQIEARLTELIRKFVRPDADQHGRAKQTAPSRTIIVVGSNNKVFVGRELSAPAVDELEEHLASISAAG